MASKKELGIRLKSLREEKRLTQQELADILFVSDKTISKWEKGLSDPGLEIIVKIADYFDVTTDFLYKGEDKNRKEQNISIIELACKEDDISRLDGADISFIDNSGHNINYFIKKYNAKRVESYLLDLKINEYYKNKKVKLFTRYICALAKDYEDDENFKVIYVNPKQEEITKICERYAEKGYHGFRVFRSLDLEEKCVKAYKWFSFRFLGDDGIDDAMFHLNTLDDKKSAVLYVKQVNTEGEITKKDFAYIPEKVFDDFLNMLEEIDFKNWENTSWGINMSNFYFELKDENGLPDCPKFYVAPGPDKFRKFVNALRGLTVRLNNKARINLNKYLDKDYDPYYRQGLDIYISKKIFKCIEEEQKIIDNAYCDINNKL